MLLSLLFVAAACLHGAPIMSAPAAFTVYHGTDAVLSVRSEPGPITSTAPPPPGGKPVLHPFLSAAALDAGYESQLRTILLQSTSADDFVARLQAAGFRIQARP